MPPIDPTGISAAKRYWLVRQQVTANNLANVSTDGFKAERVFARLLSDGSTVADTGHDLRQGSHRSTGSPLGLALEGPGYFVVQTDAGERLSRGGSFHLDEGGRIVDAGGNAVLGENGPIVPGSGTIAIDTAGKITVGGREVATLRLVEVPESNTGQQQQLQHELQHEGGTLFVTTAECRPMTNVSIVRQGVVEESNVNALSAMVDMIAISRAYAALEQADGMLDHIDGLVKDLGKPA